MRCAIRPQGSSCRFLKQLPLPADLRLDARRDRTHTAAGPSWLKTLSPSKCHTRSGSPALTRAGGGVVVAGRNVMNERLSSEVTQTL